MSASWIDPSPPQQGMGCFTKGCLILIAFCILLGLAFIGGTFYAVHYLRTAYFPKTSVLLPAVTASEQEQQLARAHWHSFERAARAHAPAHIEMTADELNALIASEPKLRGKAFVTIEDNVGHLRVSVPLEEVRWLRGHYINAECTVQSAVGGRPADARITSIIVNGKPVAEEGLNWRGPWSFRRYIEEWTETNDLKRFEIENGKVILETKGSEEEKLKS